MNNINLIEQDSYLTSREDSYLLSNVPEFGGEKLVTCNSANGRITNSALCARNPRPISNVRNLELRHHSSHTLGILNKLISRAHYMLSLTCYQ